MFIECRSCDGSGEGLYGHSWTPCPVCHGAGQVFKPQAVRPVLLKLSRAMPNSCQLDVGELDPTSVFPDAAYGRRKLATA